MKKYFYHLTFLTALLGEFSSCRNSEPYKDEVYIQSDTVSIDSSRAVILDTEPVEEEEKKLNLFDIDGNQVNISIKSGTMYCNMATWCPHSDQLIKNINNNEFKHVFKSYKIVFLFSKTEVEDYIKNHKDDIRAMAEEKGIPYKDVLKRFQNIADVQDQFNLEMFNEIPTNISYYFYDKNFNYKLYGFPQTYSYQTNVFSQSPYEWLAEKDQSLIPELNKMEM